MFIADTWRKEYKSRTFKPAHYFSKLPRDVRAHATRTRRKKTTLNNEKYYEGEECALFRRGKYIFSLSNEILHSRVEVRIGTEYLFAKSVKATD